MLKYYSTDLFSGFSKVSLIQKLLCNWEVICRCFCSTKHIYLLYENSKNSILVANELLLIFIKVPVSSFYSRKICTHLHLIQLSCQSCPSLQLTCTHPCPCSMGPQETYRSQQFILQHYKKSLFYFAYLSFASLAIFPIIKLF